METLKIKKAHVIELINLYSLKHYEYNTYLELENDSSILNEWLSLVGEYMDLIVSLNNKGVDMKIIHRIIEKASTPETYNGYLLDMVKSCNIDIID